MVFLILLINFVHSQAGSCGKGCTWTFENGKLTISGTSSIDNYQVGSRPWEDIRNSIKEVVVENGIGIIGTYAFSNCEYLTTVEIGASSYIIEDNAFSGCTSLKIIKYSQTMTPDCGSNVLENTAIEYIQVLHGYHAEDFCGEKKLKIEGSCNSNENNLCRWGYYTVTSKFEISGTGEIDDWTSSQSPPWDWYRAKATQITIGDGITKIGNYAFYGFSQTTQLTIGNSVKTIGDYAFRGCFMINQLTIPYSVDTIGDYAFYYCPSLTKIEYLGTNEPTCESNVFDNEVIEYVYVANNYNSEDFCGQKLKSEGSCNSNDHDPCKWEYDWETKKLEITGTGEMDEWVSHEEVPWKQFSNQIKEIGIGESITKINQHSFDGCTSLEKIELSENNQNYILEEGVLFDKDKNTLIHYPSKLVGTEYTIPDSVTTIGNNAFESCTSLTSIIIPSSVTTLGDHAFESCTSLKYITIPKQVNSIGDYAFKNSHRLTEIVFMGDKEQEITCDSNVFDEITYFENIKVKNSYQGETFCGKEVEKTNICLEQTTIDQSTGDCGCIGNAKVVEKTNGRKCQCEDAYHYVDGECKLKIACGEYTTKNGDVTNTEPCECVDFAEFDGNNKCKCAEHAEFEEKNKSCQLKEGYFKNGTEYVKFLQCGKLTTMEGGFSPNCSCVKNAIYEEGKNETQCVCQNNYSWDEKTKECVSGAESIFISFLILIIIMVLF